MQHHQRGNNGGNIHRHHHGGIFRESQMEEVSRNNIDQVRHNQRQAGGIGNKPCSHYKCQRSAFTESQSQQHGNNDRRQDESCTIIGK
ncbi:Zn-dependent proteases [Klebsiella pneumoniae]|nr:Zn-dependent proteases [Klebsiella pneumoniae]VGC17264.1 Zn-dependent proteases [Klebsiella pneumoniae]VGC49801.1 Zn-dependent proteases [Klebsiella pneumoniae]